MARMQDLLKSSDEQKKKSQSEKKEKKSTSSRSISFSGLAPIRKAIQENIKTQGPSQIFASEATPQPPPVTTTPKMLSDEQPVPKIEIPRPKHLIIPLPAPFQQKASPQTILPKAETIVTTPPLRKEVSKENNEEFAANQLYMEFHRLLEKTISDIRQDTPIGIEPIMKLIPEFVNTINSNEFLFLKAIQRKRYATWLISHSVNVAIFSIKICNTLKYEREKLIQLALAVILHDVGMVKVPDQIISKPGKLSDSEFQYIREHPIHGYNIVKHLKDEYPQVATLVYQEHEREDGSGYPQGLKGNEIAEFSKIVGIADVFEALVHGRAYRDGFITYNAFQKIIEGKAKQFNSKIIRSLVNGVSMYPIGSLVKLSTKEVARVIAINSLRPVRPIVEILEDNEGRKPKVPIRINLEQEPLIYIVKPIEE